MEEEEKAEMEKNEQEERAQKEHEEYLLLKEAFTVDQEGFDETEAEKEVLSCSKSKYYFPFNTYH